MNNNFKKLYKEVFSLVRLNGLCEFKNEDDYEVYTKELKSAKGFLIIKLKQKYDYILDDIFNIEDCTFFQKDEELFKISSRYESGEKDYVSFTVKVNGEYLDKQQENKLFVGMGLEQLFEDMKKEQLLIRDKLKLEKKNREDERNHELSTTIDNILNNNEFINETVVEIRRKSLKK